MIQQQDNEKLYTPREIETTGYKGFRICQATQVQYRKNGLRYFRIGNKILYSEKHLADFLSLCEKNDSTSQN